MFAPEVEKFERRFTNSVIINITELVIRIINKFQAYIQVHRIKVYL